MRGSENSVAGGGANGVEPEGPVDRSMSQGRARSALPHLPTVLVLLAALGMTLMLAAVSRDVAKDQEQALLEERVSEVTLLLQASLNPISSSLAAAGAVGADEGDSQLFQSISLPLTLNGGQMIVVEQRDGEFVEIAKSGSSDAKEPTPTATAGVLARALTADGAVTDLVEQPDGLQLIFALAITSAPGTVAYLTSPIDPTETTTTPDPDSPYRELNVAVYVGDEVDPDKLLLSSGENPSEHEEFKTEELTIGADTWLVVGSVREPLVGGFAAKAPWFTAGAGLLLSLVLAFGVEVLVRRRAYALRLVDERTASLREAQQAAEKANRAKSDFLSRMSHELRTPLNSVLGFAQLLALDDLTEEQADSLLQISRGGRHLLDLINEILDISRIETGNLSISLEPVLADEVIAEVGSLVRAIADERGVSLRFDPGLARDTYIAADRRRVKQILLNLMGNAIKYNQEGGWVSLSCSAPEEGMLRVIVSDSGQGIPEDKFDLLFEPFERLGAEATSIEGTGVGLALSRGLAEAMGGTIGFTSKLGQGSSFWLEIPVSPGPTLPDDEDHPEIVAPDPDADRHTVLCVEDNPTNLKLVERVLKRRPHVRLVSTPNGQPAVDLALQSNAAVILLDMNLGDMSGSDVLRALREHPGTAEIPVVVVSADATPTRVEKLLNEGARAYLTKPIDVEELLAIVDEMLADARPGVV